MNRCMEVGVCKCSVCELRERERNRFISNSMSLIHRHDKIHIIQLIQNRSNIVQLILLGLLPIAQAPWN